MITALDTNILLDILIPNEKFFRSSTRAITRAATAGSLVICGIVYVEMSGFFASQTECDEFLGEFRINVEELQRPAYSLASGTWVSYRKSGGDRTRILADFLIASHAQLQANKLLSRDRGFYGKLFPKLTVIDPAEPEAMRSAGQSPADSENV